MRRDPRERLKRWIKKQGGYVASAGRLGCDVGNLHKIANGKRGPGRELRKAIQVHVGITTGAWDWA